MALTNYVQLQAAIAEELNRTDMGSIIPDLVTRCEARIRRTLKSLPVVELDDTLTTSSLTLPTGVRFPTAIVRTDPDYEGEIRVLPDALFFEKKREFGSGSGVPQYARLVHTVTDSVLHVIPAPSGAGFAVRIEYEPEVTPLATVAANWWLTNHPDLYLYGACAESGTWLREDERIGTWNARFLQIIDELNLAAERGKLGSALPLVARPRTTLG